MVVSCAWNLSKNPFYRRLVPVHRQANWLACAAELGIAQPGSESIDLELSE
jgi:hypothetical protein